MADDKHIIERTLATLNIETGVRTIIHQAKEHFEAPNGSRDGKEYLSACIIHFQQGDLYDQITFLRNSSYSVHGYSCRCADTTACSTHQPGS